jgi:predicted permease
VPGEIVSGNYFRVLGVGMTRGRGFTAEETASVGGPLVTVVSHRAWVERFGSDPGLIGGSVRLNGQPYTVVGVVDESFVGLRIDATPPEFWVPLSTQPVSMPTEDWNPLTSMGDFWLSPFARLRDGVTLEQASAETSAFMASMLEAYPEQTEGMSLELTERIAVPNPSNRGELATILGILLGVVGLVLAVVCSNLANLFLSRASARRGEIAIRLALGSGRARVLRQLLLEGLVLSLSGGLLGLALAGSFAELVVRLYGRTLAVSMTPDLGIALFALLASVGSGLLFGLVPALRATRGDALPGLSDGGSRIAAGTVRLRRSFAVAQVALSVVLLVASALFVRSIRNLAGVDPGFDAQRALAVGFTLAPAHGELTEEEGWALYRRMVERLEGVPGVEAVAIALNTPFGGSERGGGFLVEDLEPPAGSNFDAPYNVVGPRYFRTMGIDVIRGREFTEEDRAGAPPVAVVSESFARRFWPEGDALGRRISRSGPDGPWIEIVGVVGDLRWRSLEDEPQASFYLPWFQRFESRGEIVVRAREARPALSGLIREEIRRLDPRLPALRVRALDSLVSSSVARYRLAASVTGAFSVLALLLAALGLYGLLSFGVSRRTREIGVRMAMGARARDVVASVTREAMMLTLVGLGLGGVAALAAVRTVRTLLYGVEDTDPVAYLSAALVLICVTALASWIPARRASRVDPAEALRSD